MGSAVKRKSGSNNRVAKNLKAKKRNPIKLRIPRTYKPEELDLEEWQRTLRKQYGVQQNFKIENIGDHPVFSEFSLTNPESGKTYKIAIRGDTPGDNYCSCPDYSINNLGTCKHIEFALSRLMKKRGAKKAFKEGCVLPYSEVYLSYGLKREIRFKAGKDAPRKLLSLVKRYFNSDGILKEDRILDFHQFFNSIPQNNGHEVRCYDDVMAYIAENQDAEHRRKIIKAKIKNGINSPIFENILKTGLYTYQRQGALFALNAGRCLIGDDMGLGKTVQALAAAELMAKLFNIQKVLIVSPTSLKYQWKTEIDRFSGRPVEVIEGLNHQRKQLYRQGSFYKLINYELVFRDIDRIREWAPDLIILDEAQRIKNWKTRTAQYVKQLESTFAIVLTGTPIENRIEELHSIMEFIDRRHFGPLYRFVHFHRIMDEGGKIIGYRDLQSIRGSLKNVLIRRKKEEVLRQLPERIDKNFFVPMTHEQRIIHDENYEIVVKLVAKWRRYKFLCEADQRRLQIALNYMRMAADNTYLVDKKTVHGPKIDELEVILKEIVIEGGEKVVIFSQWLRMAELVERVLKRNSIGYVHLNGSVPSKQRKGLISRFREDPECKVFLSTDAGGVGLNLQSGSVVINMDIPWNPAVLEQRIGRVHRLGQHKNVRAINFITKSSIEERILDLLKFKKSLFAGALDKDGKDIVMVGESQLKKFMQSVETMTENLEKPDPELERRQQRESEQAAKAVDMEEITTVKGDESTTEGNGNGLDTLNNLLISGARFLTNLSKTLSKPEHQAEKYLDIGIDRDTQTGKAYLKIPFPETEVMNNIFSALGEFLSDTIHKNSKTDQVILSPGRRDR
ncbi:MAG TPA: DEAD/DEAH box helicase [Nitrospirae bacterium]|nr:DEAD/DEAH box helicase [Nitrospirota bacterium]